MPLLAILHFVGLSGVGFGLAMLVPLGVAILSDDALGIRQFGLSAFWLGVAGLLLLVATRQFAWPRHQRRPLIWLGIILWIWLPLAGALPFWGWQGFGFGMAWFESVSFFTTTSVSLASGDTPLSPAMLVWRALLTLMGAIWALGFLLAIVRPLGGGGVDIRWHDADDYYIDVIQQWPILLWAISWRFLLLVAIGIGGLLAFDVPPKLAFGLGISALATAGFAPVTMPLANAISQGALVWLSGLMMIGAISFPLWMSWDRIRSMVRDLELRGFGIWFGLVAVACIFWGQNDGVVLGLAQTANLVSTSGLPIIAHGDEPISGMALNWALLPCIVGGMSLSTAGGLKMFRILLGSYAIQKELQHIANPLAMPPPNLFGQAITDEHSRACWAYIAGYMLCLICGLVAASLLLDSDFAYSLQFVVAHLSNINIASLVPDKVVMLDSKGQILGGLLMLAGRLEILLFLLLLFLPLWRR